MISIDKDKARDYYFFLDYLRLHAAARRAGVLSTRDRKMLDTSKATDTRNGYEAITCRLLRSCLNFYFPQRIIVKPRLVFGYRVGDWLGGEEYAYAIDWVFKAPVDLATAIIPLQAQYARDLQYYNSYGRYENDSYNINRTTPPVQIDPLTVALDDFYEYNQPAFMNPRRYGNHNYRFNTRGTDWACWLKTTLPAAITRRREIKNPDPVRRAAIITRLETWHADNSSLYQMGSNNSQFTIVLNENTCGAYQAFLGMDVLSKIWNDCYEMYFEQYPERKPVVTTEVVTETTPEVVANE